MSEQVTYSPTVRLQTPGLAVGLPFCDRPVHPFWSLALIAQNWPTGMNRLMIPMGQKDYNGKAIGTGEQRNEIVKMAKEPGASYLCMIDDDTEIPFWGVRHLLNTLKQEQAKDEKVMVVGGIYCTRSMPVEPVVGQAGKGCDWNWRRNTVFPVTGYIGTGAILIDMRLFDLIPYPWFKDINIGADELSGVNGVDISDDVYFCDKVLSSGYKIMADGYVICRHWDAVANKAYILPEDSYPMQEAVPAGVFA